jgi:hypothetical protein
VAWRVRFRFEDGPRDCEAMAVDPEQPRALLLSKRTEPPVLYELTLLPGAPLPSRLAGKVTTSRHDLVGNAGSCPSDKFSHAGGSFAGFGCQGRVYRSITLHPTCRNT